ncbi:MAG: toprim domain-containing protein, partial [Ruminococcus bromii]|nr:toprim domain-containing protein [Ruminococcus bromii]
MIHIREAVIVEGRYDKIKLSALTDALVIETNGFGIYKDAEKRDFIQKLAAERGIVILTDSDNAGRQIRSYLCSFIPNEQIRHAYIPDIYGKEKRKTVPSKEGKLG